MKKTQHANIYMEDGIKNDIINSCKFVKHET
jgi:hypothetical protein